MAKAIEASVKPSVLKWARESSGTTVEEAAKRLRVPASTFAEWETVESSLKLSQLRTLAAYFKRPLAALLLPEPPPEPALPTDFRTLRGHQRGFDRGTRFAIRKAIRLRSVARDLMHALQREAAPMIDGANLSEGPERLAERERQHRDVSVEAQFEWKNPWQAFREWRAVLEQECPRFPASHPSRGCARLLLERRGLGVSLTIRDFFKGGNHAEDW